MTAPDLIVVGAGSAGCILAARLTREFGIRVALVEPPASEAPPIDRQRPVRWLNLIGSADDWGLQTQPVPELASRSLAWPRGRGLGGSSRINALIWFPPTDRDLALLDASSGGKWRPEEVSAACQALETDLRPEPPAWLSEPSQRFLAAAEGLGDAVPMIYRRLQRQGRRWLPSEMLPPPHEAFQIIRGTVDRLLWDNQTAVGVRLQNDSHCTEIRASLGVVLTAGAIATPAILVRSGVGEREELKQLGIDPRVDMPSVGHHLQDHLIMPVVFQRIASQAPFRSRATMQDLARWQTMGTGPIASNLAECGGLFEGGTIQIHATPTHYLAYPKQDAVPWMTLGVNVTQPRSTGRLRLTSRNPQIAPQVEPGYLQQSVDLDDTIAGVRLARRLAARSPLLESIHEESLPGAKRTSEEAVARAIRRYAQTLYHPVGTCRLGVEPDAPVNHLFAVRGTNRLWVVDGSLLPKLTVGNPNATIMSLAWMAAPSITSQL